MSDDVVRRYNGARPIQAPAQLLADAIHEIEVLREENARLLAANKDLQFHFDVVKEDLEKAEEENARLEQEKMTIHNIVLPVGVYTLVMCGVRIVMALIGDRSGNSGSYKKWDEEE